LNFLFEKKGRDQTVGVFRAWYFLTVIVGLFKYRFGYELFLLHGPAHDRWIYKLYPVTSGEYRLLFAATVVTALFSMFGIFTRWSLVSFLCSFFLYESYVGSLSYTTNLTFFVALGLLATPLAARQFSVDEWRGKPGVRDQVGFFELVIFALGAIYLSSALTKFLQSGFSDWPEVASQYFHIHYLYSESESVLPMLNRPSLTKFGAWATLVFESTFILCYFVAPLRRVYFITGIAFHLSVYLTMEINFFDFFVSAYPALLLARRDAK
jgi:hypothetical protein